MHKSISDPKIQLEKKQCYLRQEIIDKGHDPQEFVQFLNEELGVNSDLDQCSMEQLESVVSKFIKKRYNSDIQFSMNRTESKEESQIKICEKISTQTSAKKIFFKSVLNVSQQQFTQVQNCIKVNLKYPDTSGFVCEVYNPQRKNMGGIMGIGGTSFLVFKIRIYGLQKQPVQRRYSDFVWLRNVLVKFFPTQIIPPIPNKKASKRTPRHIQKRMRILTLFLTDLIKMPILFNNKYMEGFLLLKDTEKFQKLKEEGENKKAYESISSTQTITGKVKIQLTENSLNFKDCLNRFVPAAEVLYKEITRNSKKVKSSIVQQINTLYEMGNQFGDLHQLMTKFNRVVKTDGTHMLQKIYVALNNMMGEWGTALKNSVEEIQKNISTFFKYVREQFMGFKQVLNSQNTAEVQFLKQKQSLDKQKEKIFLLHDVKKWSIPKTQIEYVPKSALNDRNQAFKIMMPKQSVHVDKMRKNVGYLLSQINLNGNDNFKRTADKFCENFKQFSIKMKVNNQQIGAMWTQMSSKFSDPYQNKSSIRKMENWDEESNFQDDPFD